MDFIFHSLQIPLFFSYQRVLSYNFHTKQIPQISYLETLEMHASSSYDGSFKIWSFSFKIKIVIVFFPINLMRKQNSKVYDKNYFEKSSFAKMRPRGVEPLTV